MAPSVTQGSVPFDVATAIEEIANGHRQIARLRDLASRARPGGGAWPENAEELFDGVMRSLATALSALSPTAKQIPAPESEVSELGHLLSPSQYSCSNGDGRRGKKRKVAGISRDKIDPSCGKRVVRDSRTLTSSKPMDDGYQWRKYGEKKIRGAQFSRCYYRCAYREDEGCQAVKQVQQADSNNIDPPRFFVTNIKQHTCTMAKIVPAGAFALLVPSVGRPGTHDLGRHRRQSGCISPSVSPASELEPLLTSLGAVDDETWDCSNMAERRDRPEEANNIDDRTTCHGGALDQVAGVIASGALCPMCPGSMRMEMAAALAVATSADTFEDLDGDDWWWLF